MLNSLFLVQKLRVKRGIGLLRKRVSENPLIYKPVAGKLLRAGEWEAEERTRVQKHGEP